MKKPFALQWDQWEEWHAQAKARHPFKYFFTETVPTIWGRFLNRIGNAKWWVLHRIHPRYRYNIVRTGLPPGYYDKPELILHASFSLLANFVEREKPGEHIDWSHDDPHQKAWSEIQDLYQWWQKRCVDESPDADADDQNKLHRLIDVRKYLWT